MENDLQRAVQCCVDPTVSHDFRQQAFSYLSQLKNSPGSWRMFMDFYFQCPGATVESKFFALQAIEETLRHRLGPVSMEDIAVMRQSLFLFLSKEYVGRGTIESSAVRNKFAQIIVTLFGLEYLETWPTFFDDLISLLTQGPLLVDMYLRIMMTIDGELISRSIHRSEAEAAHAGLLKDAMRERAIVRIVDTWYDILVHYHRDNPELANHCLYVVKVFVEWIDVNLIVSKRFIEALFTFLNNRTFREAACECVNEIVLKGMKAVSKIQLIQALQLPQVLTGFVDSMSDPYELFYTKVAHLFNDIGVTLASCWAELGEHDSTSSSGGPGTPTSSGRSSAANLVLPTLTAEQLQMRQAQDDCYAIMEQCLPAVLKLLGSENEGLSRIVTPFTQAVLGIYKQEKRQGRSVPPAREQTLSQLLRVIVGRLQHTDELALTLPDALDGAEGTEETEFDQLRKVLKSQIESIASLDDTLVFTLLSDVSMQTLADLHNQSLMRVELVLYLTNLLGDSIRGQIKYTRNPAVNDEGSRPVEVRLSALLSSIITSDVAACANPVIQMAYMDTMVRFNRYFEIMPEALAVVVPAFLDTRGLHHPSLPVRSYAMRQFVKFVRALKPKLFEHINTILTAIEDLLNVTATIVPPSSGLYAGPTSPALRALQSARRRRSSSFSDTTISMFNDQLNLFEAAGLLVSHENLQISDRTAFVRVLLAPIGELMERIVKQGLYKLDTDDNPYHILSLHHAIHAVGSIAKGFPIHAGQVDGWEEMFIATFQVTLSVLDILPDVTILKDAARFMFQRLMPALGREILPLLPAAVVRLLRDAQMRDVIDFVPLLSQLIYRFKSDIAAVFDEVLSELIKLIFGFLNAASLAQANTNGHQISLPAVSAVAAGTGATTVNSYETLVLLDLKKAYLNLVLATLNNDVGEVFTSERNRGHLDAVLASVTRMASTIESDVHLIKLAIAVLMKMIDVFTFGGFADYAIDHILPIPFIVPSASAFNSHDAQIALMVVNELAALQRHVVLRFGQKAIDTLASQLAYLGLSQKNIQEYLQAVLSTDAKSIRNYYRAVLSTRK